MSKYFFLFIIILYEGNWILHRAQKSPNLYKYCPCLCVYVYVCGYVIGSADPVIEPLPSL